MNNFSRNFYLLRCSLPRDLLKIIFLLYVERKNVKKLQNFPLTDRYAQHTQANDHTEKFYLKKAEKLVSMLFVLNVH